MWGETPSHWLLRHDVTREWVVGKQTSPLSQLHAPGSGWGA